ncbi:MAG: hypothetical protein EXR79_07030 [Myxococcales bacterium]|nr:hypothetical protein [Myxococcales bacterium]
MAWVALSCSAPQTGPRALPTTGATVDVSLPALRHRVRIAPPAGWTPLDSATWSLPYGDKGDNVALLLHVHGQPEPARGAMAEVDRVLADLQKGGAAGVQADRRVTLGDLDGRYIQTVELRGDQPKGLWMTVTAAEGGQLVTATAAGLAADLVANAQAVEAALLSLRVDPPESVRGERAAPLPAELDLTDDATPVRR